MNEVQKRNILLQILRGFAIVLVLIRHAIAQVSSTPFILGMEKIIICLHMPVFFVLSGYLFEKNLSKYQKMGKMKFLKKKAIHLLVPYVFWFLILWFCVCLICSFGPFFDNFMRNIGFAPMNIFTVLYGIFTFETYYMEHLWFLYVLFLLFFFNIFLAKWGSNKIVLGLSLLLGLVFSMFHVSNIIDRFFLWSVYFFFGRFLGNSEQWQSIIKNVSKVKLFSICFIFLLGCFLRLYILNSFANLAIINSFVKYVIGFSGLWLLNLIAMAIFKLKLGKFFKWVGDYSYEIYLMHNPYCVATIAILLNKFFSISPYIAIVISVIFGIVIPILLSKVIMRSKVLSFVMLGKIEEGVKK